ncbi:uncharacterized protein EKO05_0011313 [Ascochyta rabiei]|uniref:Uncharacterized protein n=1 Tax=Didymella rabiei TaxID=5454 RepID=A0A162WEJ8_DIDRA|nr:uncharacterized protein EKO05_0011313 [Ascochyta rabiei]KZM18977.1 hypothetical protein ST47_g9878 [Ascochyta rabiei]UPX21111.1 hypothetical protein EKO05_0011313 [Ascochyta rabiei]
MRSTSTVLFLATLLAPFVAADLHSAAICIDTKGGASVYNAAATKKACESYKARNTGNKQWDSCPDCQMKVIGNLNLCHSGGWHIGGSEMKDYCNRLGGAGGSLAN